MIRITIVSCCLIFNLPFLVKAQQTVLHTVSVYIDKTSDSNAETAAAILIDEVKKRTGLKWNTSTQWLLTGDIIILRTVASKNPLPLALPNVPNLPVMPESFRLTSIKHQNRVIILIEGYDRRGVLYGVGQLLRKIQYRKGSVVIPRDISISASPDKAIRGHQLGYRSTANSYDGWSVAQYDQYVRELIIFGTNSIETIPFFDQKASPHFKVPPAEMNTQLSKICKRYDLDFWMWIPAQFDLTDRDKRKKYLDTLDKTLSNCERVNGLFFPGGDPGDNAPGLVIPLLKDIAELLQKKHPSALVWLSLQGYNKDESQFVYNFIRHDMPSWFGGIVTGPGSPPVWESKMALPPGYQLRYYPDITHNVRCEFPVRWWDPAFNFTLGREAANPRPYQYAAIYRALKQYINGFISYSDGIHDDVNKIIWTQLAWNPHYNERDILKEYANFFFVSTIAEKVADGIIALERNWEGPIVQNGSIESTLTAWQEMEKKEISLAGNWRWELCLLRAYYDAYTRKRFLYETALENKANEALMEHGNIGVDKAISKANKILSEAETKPIQKDWKKRIVELCQSLFKSISLQTSVTKYQASGSERGAVLDFIDRPLNNRWWMEDECTRIMKLQGKEQTAALETLALWEKPGEGSFYDDVGNVSNSPHVLRGENWITDPLMLKGDNQGYDWWENGYSRKRLSWMSNMRWPAAMEYYGLDSMAQYTVRITGFGESRLRANGDSITPTLNGKGIGEIKEFPIPKALTQRGHLILTWDDINEENVNWRLQSRVTEVWLIKNKSN